MAVNMCVHFQKQKLSIGTAHIGEREKYVEEGSGLFPGYGGPVLSEELLD